MNSYNQQYLLGHHPFLPTYLSDPRGRVELGYVFMRPPHSGYRLDLRKNSLGRHFAHNSQIRKIGGSDSNISALGHPDRLGPSQAEVGQTLLAPNPKAGITQWPASRHPGEGWQSPDQPLVSLESNPGACYKVRVWGCGVQFPCDPYSWV